MGFSSQAKQSADQNEYMVFLIFLEQIYYFLKCLDIHFRKYGNA